MAIEKLGLSARAVNRNIKKCPAQSPIWKTKRILSLLMLPKQFSTEVLIEV